MRTVTRAPAARPLQRPCPHLLEGDTVETPNGWYGTLQRIGWNSQQDPSPFLHDTVWRGFVVDLDWDTTHRMDWYALDELTRIDAPVAQGLPASEPTDDIGTWDDWQDYEATVCTVGEVE